MNSQPTILLGGEIGTEVAQQIEGLLRARGHPWSLAGEGRKEYAHAFPLAETIAVAAAVAAILDFLLNLRREVFKQASDEKPDERAKAELETRLEEYEAHGYETTSVEVSEVEDHRVTKCRVVIQDVPNRTVLEVEMISRSYFKVSRSKVTKTSKAR
jgi:hypothetical protein